MIFVKMLLFFCALMVGWCQADQISFPDDKPKQANETSARLGGWVLGKFFEVSNDGNIGVSFQLKPYQKPAYRPLPQVFPPLPSKPKPFPILGAPTVSPISISFPPSSCLPTGTEPDGNPCWPKPEIFPPVEYSTCDCMPVQLCVNTTTIYGITTRIVTSPPTGMACPAGQVYCCIETTKWGCGVPNIIPGGNPKEGQAHIGEFPWSAIVLTQDNAYVGGGILVSSFHVLTATHRVVHHGKGSGLKVRFGDWDVSSVSEPVQFMEVNVASIVSHPNFDPVALTNDISVIILATPVPTLTKPFPQINTICLPDVTMDFTGERCLVSGWGKDQFYGEYQRIIKKIDVPVLPKAECQLRLRNTRLGKFFTLDQKSFICAGGEANKDACTGDGGNALACLKNGKFYVAGITAGGIECGNEGVPGLYVNVVSYLPWLQGVMGSGGGGGGSGPDIAGGGVLDPRRS